MSEEEIRTALRAFMDHYFPIGRSPIVSIVQLMDLAFRSGVIAAEGKKKEVSK